VLSVQRVFGDLGQDDGWVAELSEALRALDALGAKSAGRLLTE
jgi:hypothetical protein